jgi:hypothetical protein
MHDASMAAAEERDTFVVRLTEIVDAIARAEGLGAEAVRRDGASVWFRAPDRTPVEFRGATAASDAEVAAYVGYFVGEVAPRNDAARISVNLYALEHERAASMIEADRALRDDIRDAPRPDSPSGDGWFAYAPNTGVVFRGEPRWRRIVARFRRR